MSAFAGWIEFKKTTQKEHVVQNMLSHACSSNPEQINILSDDLVCIAEYSDTLHNGLIIRDNLILVASARLDNKKALAKKLIIDLADLDAVSDPELIYFSYKKWGANLVNHLTGDFAFVFWIPNFKQVFMGRDHVGSKQLVYYYKNDKLLFATSIKSLLASGLIARKLNESKFIDQLILEQQDAEQTFFEDVYILPAGHSMTIKSGKCIKSKYWNIDTSQRLTGINRDEILLECVEIFSNAVTDRLETGVRNAVMLSGGLDSSAVASVAARSLATKELPLVTYTAVPSPQFSKEPKQGSVYDERVYVESLVEKYPNILDSYIDAHEYGLISTLEDTFETAYMPPRNLINQLWIQAIADEAAQANVKNLLTGITGNYFLSYDGSGIFLEKLFSMNWISMHRQLQALAKSRSKNYMQLFKKYILFPLFPDSLWRIYQEYFRKNLVVNVREIVINPDLYSNKQICALCKGSDPYFRGRANWRQEVVAALDIFSGDVACLEKGVSIKSGVNLLDPTRDKRLIEFVLSVPTEFFINEGRTRLLVRDGLQEILPTAIRNRTDYGLQGADWQLRLNAERDTIKQEIQRLSQHDLVRKFIDIERVGKIVDSSSLEDSLSANILTRGLTMAKFIEWVEN